MWPSDRGGRYLGEAVVPSFFWRRRICLRICVEIVISVLYHGTVRVQMLGHWKKTCQPNALRFLPKASHPQQQYWSTEVTMITSTAMALNIQSSSGCVSTSKWKHLQCMKASVSIICSARSLNINERGVDLISLRCFSDPARFVIEHGLRLITGAYHGYLA